MSRSVPDFRKILAGITRPSRQLAPLSNPHGAPGFMNRFRARVVGPDGEVKKETDWIYNIMNTYGLASLASRVGTASGANSNSTELVSAMKIGTGTTAATSTDAALVASTASVTMGNASLTKTNLGNRTVEYQCTFASNNPAGAASITEVGLYCNSTADSQLFARAVLTGANSVNKGNSDTIQCSYDVILTTA